MSDDPARPELPTPTRRGFLQSVGTATGALAVTAPALHAAPAAPPTPATPLRTPPRPVALTVNGTRHDLLVEPRVTLLDALREHAAASAAPARCWSTAAASTAA
jgi:xanthine dehydrogenase YagT iron-sulfur-binding subunit